MSTHFYMYCTYAFVVAAVLAAMAWLRPGSAVLKRSLLITLSYVGLLLIFQYRVCDARVGECCRLLLLRGDIVLLLLGRYLLRKPWKELCFALGVYGLVAWGMNFLPVFQLSDDSARYQAIYAAGSYLNIYFRGCILWLFARSAGHSYTRSFLLCAAAHQAMLMAMSLQSILWVFCGPPDPISIIVGGRVAHSVIACVIDLLMLRLVFQLSWVRCVLCVLTFFLFDWGSLLLFFACTP